MHGPDILVQSLQEPTAGSGKPYKHGNLWQYHPRTDRDSKIVCWGILFDLLGQSKLLSAHAREGSIGFGINHEMRDFKTDKKKNLDLVICTPGPESKRRKKADHLTFKQLIAKYQISLTEEQQARLATLPDVQRLPVGQVHIAIEVKACMTEFGKAHPRLYDELTSSHEVIHGANTYAIAGCYVLVNAADRFVSPGRNDFQVGERLPVYTPHKQPHAVRMTYEKITRVRRRDSTQERGFDAIGFVVIQCVNDGSPIRLIEEHPAVDVESNFHYEKMVGRIAKLYDSRFPHE